MEVDLSVFCIVMKGNINGSDEFEEKQCTRQMDLSTKPGGNPKFTDISGGIEGQITRYKRSER